MLKGGGGAQQVFRVVLTQELEALAILKVGVREGDAKGFQHLKEGGRAIVYPVLKGMGGGDKKCPLL